LQRCGAPGEGLGLEIVPLSCGVAVGPGLEVVLRGAACLPDSVFGDVTVVKMQHMPRAALLMVHAKSRRYKMCRLAGSICAG
jgi:hypothetical protein